MTIATLFGIAIKRGYRPPLDVNEEFEDLSLIIPEWLMGDYAEIKKHVKSQQSQNPAWYATPETLSLLNKLETENREKFIQLKSAIHDAGVGKREFKEAYKPRARNT